MVIQNNIPGLNSKINYNKNSSKLAKSLEKLSSGYAINRAADAAAGLAVSEKMRSQICGMKQSVKNCQDGISLIQTFEGALGETVAIIHRAKSLADQMANGTYDDNVDRSAVEIEYLHLCDEVNHIAETDFNVVVMLNGKGSANNAVEIERAVNSAISGSSNNVSSVSAYSDVPQTVSVQAAAFAAPKAGGTACGDFTVYGNSSDFSFSGGVLTIWGGNVTVEGTGAPTTNTIVVAKDKSANVTLKNVNIDVSGTDNACAFKIEDDSKGDVTVTLEGDNTLKSGKGCAGLQKNGDVNSGTLTINGNGSLSAFGAGYSGASLVGGTGKGGGAGIGGGSHGIGANIIISSGDIYAKGGEYGAGIGGGDYANGELNIKITGGTITAQGGEDGAGIGGGACGDVSGVIICGGKVNARGGDYAAGIGGGEYGYGNNITISGGEVYARGGRTFGGAGIGGGGSEYWTRSGDVIIQNEGTVVIAKGGTNADDIGSGGGGRPGEEYIVGNTTVKIDSILTKESYTDDEINDGTIVHYTGRKPDPPEPDDPYTPDTPENLIVSIPNAFGNAAAKLTYTDELILQVGARTKDSVNFTFDYSSDGIGGLAADLNCTAKGLGMDTLTLKTQESANFAIDRLDHALNKVSMIRATFGAAQNRLEHKIDNLNNTTENLTAAEFVIRDTDMAKEMMNFTKNQILTQSSQSMLAQVNSLPQQVMSLISG